MQKIGYPNIYSHETYTDMYHPTKEFMEDHRANYFGMEDSVHLPAVLDWVDDMKNKTDPFFLTYLSGVTHDPYDMPPHWEGRKPQFSKDKKINGYLNAISYTDEFLKNVTQEFDKRNLTENTLFVLMGDHGFTAKQRTGSMTTFDVNFEEAFNVGVTFHTKNKKVAKRLRAAKAHVEKGKWVSIDVIPTILNILNLPNFQPPTASNTKSKINSNSTTSSVPLSEFADGRSMLQPSGKRLQVSLSNPGDGMVLRDGDRLIVVPVNEVPEIFDMELDPGQLKPIPIDQSGVTDKRIKDHIKWGKKAAAFVDVLKNDILRAYKTGKRCTSVHKACALELLASLESLDQWEGPSSKTMDQTTFSTRWFPFLRSS
jgi:arylsulfatase A-like enzyme